MSITFRRFIPVLFAFLAACAPLNALPPATLTPGATFTPAVTLTPTQTSTPLPPSATPTPAPSIVFPSDEYPTLLVTIPDFIASGAEIDIVAQGRRDTPLQQDLPRHILIELKGYPNPSTRYKGPAIRVFPVAPMEVYFGNHLENMRGILNGRPPSSGIYPAFPIISGVTTIQIRAKLLNFRAGKGVRYLEYEDIPTADTLSTSPYMNYIYQGISTDGKYYISVILPVAMPFLNETAAQIATQAAEQTTPQPLEVLMFPILLQLQGADDKDFLPSLADLDAIVASMDLKP